MVLMMSDNTSEQQETKSIGIENLQDIQSMLESDVIHVIRQSDINGGLLSYKTNAKSLGTMYMMAAELLQIESKLNNLSNKLNTFVSKFPKKESVDASYVSKTQKEAITAGFLTKSNFDSTIAKYVTRDDLDETEALDRKETMRLAEEMTDFAAAAMVGINQSSSSIQSTETPTKGG